MRYSACRKRGIYSKLLFSLTVLVACASARAQTNSTPFLYPLRPAATAPGGPAFSLSVTGTGFVSGAVVNWNGSPRPTTFVSHSKVTAAISSADIATSRTALITVTNPPPGGGTSNSQFFQVTFRYDALTFQDSIITAGSGGAGVLKVAVGDFNGDGKPDLVELNSVLNSQGSFDFVLQLLLGKGDGTFQEPIVIFAAPRGATLTLDLVGDVNGDGKADLIGSYSNTDGSRGTFVFLGNGDGTFQPPLASGGLPGRGIVLADVNGDGILDLVGTCSGVCVALGNGDGTFRAGSASTVPFVLPAAITLGDFRQSGKLDAVVAFNRAFSNDNPSAYFLVRLPGNGDGTFGPPSVIFEGTAFAYPTFPFRGLESLLAADFYADGDLDLAFYSFNGNAPSLSDQAVLSSMRGNGDGTFQSPLSVMALPDDLRQQSILVPGDFNGDGHIDLAASNVVTLLGNGGGPDSFSVVSTQSPFLAYAAADFNGDGRLDLVGIDDNQNVHVLLQNSVPDFSGSINDPAFQNVRPGGTTTYSVEVASLNGFAGAIQFSATGLPPGATATFHPPSLAGSGTVFVTISTSKHTPQGSYLILLSGTSLGVTHSGGVRLNVGPAHDSFEDFGGTVSPALQTVVPGARTTYQINIFPLYGFDTDVHLEVSGLPPGATAAFSPRFIAGGSGSSVLTISTGDLTPTGTYHLTITAHGGGVRHANGMNLNVVPAGSDSTGSITPPR